MKEFIILIFKGVGMGAANVIPGVSGGTIALITGIFEKLIDSIKAFDLKALKLIFSGKFKEFANHVNLSFLIAVFIGVGVSVFSLAFLLDFLFINYRIYVWAFFFGLILASVYFVGKTIEKWNIGVILMFIIGTGIAVSISILSPGKENDATWYLLVCGVVAVCSMILPGLSGSFVLILMGNYQLIMLDSVKHVNLKVLAPVAVGAVVGLIGFSHILSFLFKKFKNQTIAVLSGFILGSLATLWPWKDAFDINNILIASNKYGAYTDASGNILEGVKVFSFKHSLPESFDMVTIFSILLMVAGIISIWAIEKFAEQKA